ncbi:MAG: hypothetical protein LBF27_31005 [Sphingobacterium sp.]|nr:hypothetical protein [Sphingobacterium sp.]
MKTIVIESKEILKGTNGTADKTADSKTDNKNIVQTKNKEEKETKPQNRTVGNGKQDTNIPAPSEPKVSEPPITVQPLKPVPNLESTLKRVEELHRRKIQRDRLIGTIDTLDSFEVELKDDADETNGNHFQGCKLTIEDDDRNQFITKNPVIIKAVAQFVKNMCVDRLGEVEAEITLP